MYLRHTTRRHRASVGLAETGEWQRAVPLPAKRKREYGNDTHRVVCKDLA